MQAPLPPHFAFTGEVRRKEWYSTVSPVIVQRSVQQPSGDGQSGGKLAQRRRRGRSPPACPHTALHESPAPSRKMSLAPHATLYKL